LGDAFTGFIEREAFAPIQRSQSVLDGLTELKLVNSVNQSCVGRELLRHFEQNFLCAHTLFIQHRPVAAKHPLPFRYSTLKARPPFTCGRDSPAAP
jgi:hypothetical protein